MAERDLARLRLIRTAGVGPVTYRQLIARFGTPEAAHKDDLQADHRMRRSSNPDLYRSGFEERRRAQSVLIKPELFASAERLREYVLSMGNNGYWHQADIWFARDGALMRSACRLICLQQQSADRAKWCNALGASRDGACARRARPRRHQAA